MVGWMFWRPLDLQRLLPNSLVVDTSGDFAILVYAISGVDMASLGPVSGP